MYIERTQFLTQNKYDLFKELKRFDDIYIVDLDDSFIKCAIQKTNEGVQVIYLDSYYEDNNHQVKLMCYVTFVIAYRINGNKGFEKIEFNKDGKII